MFKENCGKLMVYASTGVPFRKRLDSVRTAAEDTAKRLNLDFEVVKLDRAGSPIYVYYEESEGEEPIPLYCDEGKMVGFRRDKFSVEEHDVCFVFSS